MLPGIGSECRAIGIIGPRGSGSRWGKESITRHGVFAD